MANPRPNPPKRKKRSSCSRRKSGGEQKQSNYDYAAAREEIGVPIANSQQVTSAALWSGTNPRAPKTKSPVKRVIKAQLNRQRNKITKLETGRERLEMKVDSLKKQVRDFSIALKNEKEKSRLAMAKLLDDAEKMMADSIGDGIDLDRKMSAAELAAEKERLRAIDAIQEERRYASERISARKSDFFIAVPTVDYSNITSITSSETKTEKGARAGPGGVGLCSNTARRKDPPVEGTVRSAARGSGQREREMD
jgi:hypothetical protein